MADRPGRPRQVVVAGGGIGGVEAVLALQALAGERVQVTLIAAESHLVYGPLSVAVPFGGAAPLRVELAALAAERGFALRHGRVTAVDLDGRRVVAGDELAYDDLVLALGAQAVPAVAGALTFRGAADVDRLREALAGFAARGGGRLVFAARTVASWTLPLYELALLTAAWAEKRAPATRITVVTPEHEPLGILTDDVGADLRARLVAAGIDHIAAAPEGMVEGGLWVPGHDRVDADLVVALPVLAGPDIPGLPRDRLRFVPVDEFCRVQGHATAYAIGDMAARHVKQGGLAAQQAAVAAACIAAAAGAPVEPAPYTPVLRGLLVTDPEATPGAEKVAAPHLASYTMR